VDSLNAALEKLYVGDRPCPPANSAPGPCSLVIKLGMSVKRKLPFGVSQGQTGDGGSTPAAGPARPEQSKRKRSLRNSLIQRGILIPFAAEI
jgi:hypothetical protein